MAKTTTPKIIEAEASYVVEKKTPATITNRRGAIKSMIETWTTRQRDLEAIVEDLGGAEKVNEILVRIATGELLRDILKEPGMPCLSKFVLGVAENQQLGDAHARARELQMDTYAEELVVVATDRSRDDEKGGATAVARDRLHIDTLKFLMAKIAPKRWGDKPQYQVAVNAATGYYEQPGRESEIEEAAKTSPAFRQAASRLLGLNVTITANQPENG